MLSTLGKIFSRRHFEIFFLFFSQKTGFDISCKLLHCCMKCQILFSGKNKKYIINSSSAENAQRVVKVKIVFLPSFYIGSILKEENLKILTNT